MSDKCKCAEMLDKQGNRITIEHEAWHNCAYVRKREQLIPKAALHVNQRYGVLPGPRFTRLFAQEMERKAREAKLV